MSLVSPVKARVLRKQEIDHNSKMMRIRKTSVPHEHRQRNFKILLNSKSRHYSTPNLQMYSINDDSVPHMSDYMCVKKQRHQSRETQTQTNTTGTTTQQRTYSSPSFEEMRSAPHDLSLSWDTSQDHTCLVLSCSSGSQVDNTNHSLTKTDVLDEVFVDQNTVKNYQ